MTTKGLSNLGRKRANEHAYKHNALKLSPCSPCNDLQTCKDSFTGAVAAARSIAAIELDGETYRVADYYMNTTSIALTDMPKIADFLEKILSRKEYNLFTEYSYEGGNLTFEHIGQVALTALVLDNGTKLTTTRCCTIVNVTKYQAYAVDTVPDVSYESNSETLANNPYPHTGVAAQDDATATQLATDFADSLTALGYAHEKVQVSVDNFSAGYMVSVYSAVDVAPTIGIKAMQNCGTEEMFSC